MIAFQSVLDPYDVFIWPPYLPKTELKQKKLENGVLFGVQSKEGFSIQGIFSTDPQDYLNPKYQIGRCI